MCKVDESLIKHIEACGYECEAGYLEGDTAWITLKRLFAIAKEDSTKVVPQLDKLREAVGIATASAEEALKILNVATKIKLDANTNAYSAYRIKRLTEEALKKFEEGEH